MRANATRQQLLIVDDEEVNRTILSLMFDADYDIVEAANGMAAIEAIEQNNDIALILLDVIMPVMQYRANVTGRWTFAFAGGRACGVCGAA